MKKCRTCKRKRLISQFAKNKGNIDGREGQCRSCRSGYHKRYYSENRERVLARTTKYQKDNREGYWARYLRREYGLSISEWREMKKAQKGRCETCRHRPGRKGFCVDHNHATGKVRGLLCFGCNSALGMMRESPATAYALFKYMLKHSRH